MPPFASYFFYSQPIHSLLEFLSISGISPSIIKFQQESHHNRFAMSKILSTALLATAATAQLTTSVWLPGAPVSGLSWVGSVIGVQNDHTTLSVSVKGIEAIGTEYAEEMPQTITVGGTTFIAYEATATESDFTATVALQCERSNGDAVPTCTMTTNGCHHDHNHERRHGGLLEQLPARHHRRRRQAFWCLSCRHTDREWRAVHWFRVASSICQVQRRQRRQIQRCERRKLWKCCSVHRRCCPDALHGTCPGRIGRCRCFLCLTRPLC
jgi:hypothetical protein